MEAMILDQNFAAQAIIDSFESFIWTDRYNKPGDFEIYMPIAKAPMEYIVRDNYIWIRESDRLQVIEDITITTDVEDGDHITISGRTLSSLLDRRRVWQSTTLNTSFQSGLQRLFNENAINPSESYRKFPKLRFIWNNDPRIAELTIEATFFGEDLLEITEAYCQAYELGFKIIYNGETETFDFSLYYGEDRSYAQEKLPWVVFSSAYDNLVGSNYFESFKNLKTAAVVIGEVNEDYGQEIVYVNDYPEMTGIARRELAVDGSSVHWEVEEVDEDSIKEGYRLKAEITAHKYGSWNSMDESEREALVQQWMTTYAQSAIERAWNQAIEEARQRARAEMEEVGKQALAETFITKTFEGKIEALRQYVYGVDFFIGDVVQVRNQYGKEASSRITEVVRSHDADGYVLTPTFTTLIGSDNEGDIRE